MPPGPGDLFGRYELLELLGRGAMGEVYAARDTLLHRRVALKLVRPPDWAPEEPAPAEAAARVLREARAAAQIAHPNAVAIYDVGEVDGHPFLAMELVTGKPLSAFVGDPGVPLERRIRWLVEVASALGAAHALGLVHRDVKPDNVMVAEGGSVKVLDFGIARRASATTEPGASGAQARGATALGTLTAAGVVLGTPFYMAPEQMCGEPFDGRADQFSWGVIAYELLAGEAPWDRSRGGVEVVSQILSREVDPPRTRNAEIPAPVDAAIQRAMRKTAPERFSRMEEIVSELEPFAEPPGSSAGDDPRGPRSIRVPEPPATPQAEPPPPVATRARTSWTAAVVVAAIFVLAVGASRVLGRRSTPGPSPADASAAVASESQMSSNPEATAAYRAGLQAHRDGSLALAQQQLDRSIELDPMFAAAHLRRALLAYDYISVEMRQDIQNARNSRALLGEHDRILLDALEPWTHAHPDLREAQRRLEVAVEAHPSDVDFAYQLAWILDQSYQFARAASAFDRVIAKDPTMAIAWCMKGRDQVGLDDVAGAVQSYGECLKVAPGATSCLEDLSSIQSVQGKCQDMVGTNRSLIAVAPDVADAYGNLAQALYATGASIDAVRGALDQKWEHVPPATRRRRQLRDEWSLAVLTGDFAEAERQNVAIEQVDAMNPRDVIHWYTTYERMLVAQEVGRNADVVRLADEYLRRRQAWQPNDLGPEPTIYVYALEVSAGGMTKADFGKLRDEWVARETKRMEGVGMSAAPIEGLDWAAARTLTVTTPGEAMAAMATRPNVRPLIDALTFTPYLEEPIGRTYLLAGQIDEAMTELTRVSGTCSPFDNLAPVFSTWAALDLGQALEARGDAQGACSAYQRVLGRWGRAKPPSRTAEKARVRATALGCGP